MHDRRVPEARLAALAAHLKAHRLDVELNGRGLLVRDPGTSAESGLITCRRRTDDGGDLWFFTADGEPLAPADRVTDAVVGVKARLAQGAAR
ncbi:hypothetical protein [Thermomonospora umbrina]|uniref:Uncharacterized protein n=1 Tax=Thermomonospora umbrina TaxID=111806 RepID=A0A3D9SMJ4_9ACTN|nr:hypothetical protein [Thermomonospora umbrina]REE97142.1 hypothetical protein DFJ69_2599 [Thermomonospora umbrina]